MMDNNSPEESQILTDDEINALKAMRAEYCDRLRVLNLGENGVGGIFNGPGIGYTQAEADTRDLICEFLANVELSTAKHKLNREVTKAVLTGVIPSPELGGPPGIDTSFKWEVGQWKDDSKKPNPVIFNAEYDGLLIEGIVRHACGHNLISTASISAAIFTIKTMIEKSNQNDLEWRVIVYGTPAEETDGAKVQLSLDGVYDGALGCLMVHPASFPKSLTDQHIYGAASTSSLACQSVSTNFKGYPVHASLNPWLGKNACDGAVAAYVNIALLRGQIYPGNRIMALVSSTGPINIIPQYASMGVRIRAETKNGLKVLNGKMKACMDAGALASDCKLQGTLPEAELDEKRKVKKFVDGMIYLDTISNAEICTVFAKSMNDLGLPFEFKLPDGTVAMGSTDQGNVSYQCPAMHAGYMVSDETAPNHTIGFTKFAGSEKAFQDTLICGMGMAAVAVRLITDAKFAGRAKEEHRLEIEKRAHDALGIDNSLPVVNSGCA